MKDSKQYIICLWLRNFCLQRGSNPKLLNQQASISPTELPEVGIFVNCIKVTGYNFRESNSTIFFCLCSQQGSTLKGKNLLL